MTIKKSFYDCVMSKAGSVLALSLISSQAHGGLLSFGLGYAMGSDSDVVIKQEKTIHQVFAHQDSSGGWALMSPQWIQIKNKEGRFESIRMDLISTVFWDEGGCYLESMGKVISMDMRESQRVPLIEHLKKTRPHDNFFEYHGENKTTYMVRESMILGATKLKGESQSITLFVGSGVFHLKVDDALLWDQLLARKAGASWSQGDVEYWMNSRAIQSIDIQEDVAMKGVKNNFYVRIKTGPLVWGMPKETWDQAYQRQWSLLNKAKIEIERESQIQMEMREGKAEKRLKSQEYSQRKMGVKK